MKPFSSSSQAAAGVAFFAVIAASWIPVASPLCDVCGLIVDGGVVTSPDAEIKSIDSDLASDYTCQEATEDLEDDGNVCFAVQEYLGDNWANDICGCWKCPICRPLDGYVNFPEGEINLDDGSTITCAAAQNVYFDSEECGNYENAVRNDWHNNLNDVCGCMYVPPPTPPPSEFASTLPPATLPPATLPPV